jgi:hypothetical protein
LPIIERLGQSVPTGSQVDGELDPQAAQRDASIADLFTKLVALGFNTRRFVNPADRGLSLVAMLPPRPTPFELRHAALVRQHIDFERRRVRRIDPADRGEGMHRRPRCFSLVHGITLAAMT